jgi:hypothetical protein
MSFLKLLFLFVGFMAFAQKTPMTSPPPTVIPHYRWIPSTIQNFTLTGEATWSGGGAVHVQSGSLQMQGEEISAGRLTLNVEGLKPTEVTFVISKAEKQTSSSSASNTYQITGTLSARGSTQTVSFPAIVNSTDKTISLSVNVSFVDEGKSETVTVNLSAQKSPTSHGSGWSF